MTTYKRAKKFVNVGEFGKAVNTIMSNGIAQIDSITLKQLQAKHPTRSENITYPTEEEIKDEKAAEEMKDSSEMHSEEVDNQLETALPSLTINATHIVASVKQANA